jgi:hypothetical protein
MVPQGGTRPCSLSLSLSEAAFGSELTDASELIVEADVVEVRQRNHELLADYPVRVLALEVTDQWKGTAPAIVELVLPGGFTPDGGFSAPYGSPTTLAPGDHLLVFARLRDLEGRAALAEPAGVRMLGLYQRVLEDGRFVARQTSGLPVTVEAIEGSVAARAVLPQEVVPDRAEEAAAPAPAEAQPPAEWSQVVDAVRAEVASPGIRVRRPVNLEEVLP